jgi:aspartyl-tRNA(Asn)/glutamyl-tRNA(Gln) amidotransferase subunit A
VDFLHDDLPALAGLVRDRKVSAREMVQHALDRVDALDRDIHAFVAVDGERALAEAAAVDELLAAGEAAGPLAGVPIGVKDLEDAEGFVTSKGSFAHASDPPAAGDSVLVSRLRAAGCVVIGKTNTPEFGCKADTVNPVFGATRNPWDPEFSPGGSSGGSAAAVAAGLVPLATASDGGGSIRIPAACCGLPGMKTSLGRVPSGGPHPPDWGHLSTRGVLARSVRDTAYALDLVVGPDPTDLRSLPMPDASWTRSLESVHAPAKVGWSPTFGYATVDDEVRSTCEAAVRKLEARGTEVVEIPVVFEDDPVTDWLRMTGIYTLRVLEHLRGTPTWERLDPYVVQLMDWMGGSVSATELVRAEDACHRLNIRLVELFHEVPLLLSPVCAGQTPRSGGQGTVNGVAGFTSAGLPVGLQVVGPQHGDVVVLRALAVLEETLGIGRLPALAGGG